MSFILDALRKSEAERAPQSSAEFTSTPPGRPRTVIPNWLWLVAALLLINLAALLGLLLRADNETAAVPTSTPAAGSVDESRSSNDSFANQVEIARRNPPPRQASVEMPANASEHSVTPTLISQAPEAVNMERQHPTIHELRASGSVNVPDLHLDIHVYSDVPTERFVFINMNKHREGSQLDEGPRVDEITPLGVILTHTGSTFLLPRE